MILSLLSFFSSKVMSSFLFLFQSYLAACMYQGFSVVHLCHNFLCLLSCLSSEDSACAKASLCLSTFCVKRLLEFDCLCHSYFCLLFLSFQYIQINVILLHYLDSANNVQILVSSWRVSSSNTKVIDS